MSDHTVLTADLTHVTGAGFGDLYHHARNIVHSTIDGAKTGYKVGKDTSWFAGAAAVSAGPLAPLVVASHVGLATTTGAAAGLGSGSGREIADHLKGDAHGKFVNVK